MTEHSLWGRREPPEPEPEGPLRPADPNERPDPRGRPADPAGTRPKHDPMALRPKSTEPLLRTPEVSTTGQGFADRTQRPAPPPSASLTKALPRIQFALGALIACALAGLIVAAVIVIQGPNRRDNTSSGLARWSSWVPAPGAAGVSQIAAHVGHQYRLADGKQLVAVTGGPMEIASLPLTPALRTSSGDINLIAGNGVLFRLCGLGTNCAIASGKATLERHLLLRREALELSLYAFRYANADYAVVFLPPKKGEQPTQAMYLPRSNVQDALRRPLDATLFHRTPNTRTITASPDAAFVQQLTSRQTFTMSFTQGNQDQRAFLVLQPLNG
jgi:hypothetical protein